MPTRVLTVPGIHSTGDHNIDRLGQLAAVELGLEHRQVELARRWAVTCLLETINVRDARVLYNLSADGDIVLAHSRGNLVVDRAMAAGRRFLAVFMFAPALPADIRFPCYGADEIHVVFDPHDRALAAAQLFPLHPFNGRAPFPFFRPILGRVGYQGPPGDVRVKSVPANPVRRELMNHSNFALDGELERWAAYVTTHGREAIRRRSLEALIERSRDTG